MPENSALESEKDVVMALFQKLFLRNKNMARPFRDGLDFFSLDVNISDDPKVEFLEASHGIIGFGVFIKLLSKIYAHSYFLQWGVKEHLIFSRRVNVDINTISLVVNVCINEGLFDKNLYDLYSILTSKRIQKQFVVSCSRRKEIILIKEFLLINPHDFKGEKQKITIIGVNVDNNPISPVVNVDINPTSPVVNVDKSTQSESESESESNNTLSEKLKNNFSDVRNLSSFVENSEKEKGMKVDLNENSPESQSSEKEKVFFSLWRIYPSRGGMKRGKPEALAYFMANFKPEQYQDLERAVLNFSNSDDAKRGIGVKDFVRFLRSKKTKKYALPAPWTEWVNPIYSDSSMSQNNDDELKESFKKRIEKK